MKKHIYALLMSLSLFNLLPSMTERKVSWQNIHETFCIPHTSDTEDSHSPDDKNVPDDAELSTDTKTEKYSFPENTDSDIYL